MHCSCSQAPRISALFRLSIIEGPGLQGKHTRCPHRPPPWPPAQSFPGIKCRQCKIICPKFLWVHDFQPLTMPGVWPIKVTLACFIHYSRVLGVLYCKHKISQGHQGGNIMGQKRDYMFFSSVASESFPLYSS